MPLLVAKAAIQHISRAPRSRPAKSAAAPGPEPKARMPLWKAVMLIVIGAFLDATKFVCAFLFFFAPVVAGGAVAGQYGAFAGWLAGAAVAGAELFPAIGGGVEFAGVALAIFLSIAGWIGIIGFLVLSGTVRLWGEEGIQHMLALFGGFGLSLVPLIDSLPTFTISLARVSHVIRKQDKKHLAEWKKKHAAFEASQRQELNARIQEAQAVYAENQQAAADEQAEAEEMAAADDNEIPDEER